MPRAHLAPSTMPAIPAATLKELWQSGQDGRLSPWEVAKALAFREASKEIHDGVPNLGWIAERLTKVGGGHPGKPALSELFAKIDADPDWYPGKYGGLKRGRKPVFNVAKRLCVARSAMAAKANNGQEPSIVAVRLACPAATKNPQTRKPFCDIVEKTVFSCLTPLKDGDNSVNATRKR